MSPQRVLLPGVCLALCCLAFGVYFGQPSVAQPPAPQPLPVPPVAGRYQMLKTGTGSEFVVMDTATGHCWERVVVYPGPAAVNGRSEWRDLGAPSSDKKEK